MEKVQKKFFLQIITCFLFPLNIQKLTAKQNHKLTFGPPCIKYFGKDLHEELATCTERCNHKIFYAFKYSISFQHRNETEARVQFRGCLWHSRFFHTKLGEAQNFNWPCCILPRARSVTRLATRRLTRSFRDQRLTTFRRKTVPISAGEQLYRQESWDFLSSLTSTQGWPDLYCKPCIRRGPPLLLLML